MKHNFKFLLFAVILVFFTALNACKQETKNTLEAAEDTVVEEVEEAAESIGDAAEQVGEAAQEAAENAEEAVSEEIQKIKVQFDSGANSKIIQSSITGWNSVDYQLNVKKGQAMNISMATQHRSLYFNIIEPGAGDAAIFNGSVKGNQFEGTAAQSGDYTIRVYLMRNAARRGETAEYRLEMIVN